MPAIAYSAGIVILAGALLTATGWWRVVFAVFAIRRGTMTIERLGFLVRSPAQVERVNGILKAFAGGFNAMIVRPSAAGWLRYCDSLPVMYRPFAHEGAAMGHTLRRFFRYRPAAFEEQVVRARPGFRYLHYVGLGFWSGMRHHEPGRLTRIVHDLDPVYSSLCYDGYGFKHGFFDYLKDPRCFDRFNRFEGHARRVAYQGVGRSFWFLFMDDHDVLIEHLHRLGEYAPDAAAGLGLAAVFVYPDRLEIAQDLGMELPAPWQDSFHLGICFGLKARLAGDPDQFSRDIGRTDPSAQEAAWACLCECDRAERQVRSQPADEPYRRWRTMVTQWMADYVQYPLAGLKPHVPERLRREKASI